MAKKLMLLVLVMSLTAFAQRGHGGGMSGSAPMGGPPSGVGGGAGMGGGEMGSGHGMGGGEMSPGRGMNGTPNQAGPKSPDTLLNQNTKLSSKLQTLLPKGVTPQQACSGFKNLGQCVAAIHVSKNLDIPFDQLKTKMTGTGAVSLGKAIQQLDPQANAQQQAEKAKQQTKQDLSSSGS